MSQKCNFLMSKIFLHIGYIYFFKSHRRVKANFAKPEPRCSTIYRLALSAHSVLQSIVTFLLHLKTEAWCSFPLFSSQSAQLIAHTNTVLIKNDSMKFKKKVSVPNMSIKLNNILPLLAFLKLRISCVLSAVF